MASTFKNKASLRLSKPLNIKSVTLVADKKKGVTAKQFDIVDLEVEDIDCSPLIKETKADNNSDYCNMDSFINAPLSNRRKSRQKKMQEQAMNEDESDCRTPQHKLLNVGRLTMELPESADLNKSPPSADEKFDLDSSSTSSMHTSIDSDEEVFT